MQAITGCINHILVVAAHPDDEILGCAGTLAKLLRNGSTKATILLLGEGPLARMNATSGSDAIRQETVKCACGAAAALGIDDVRFAGLPDNAFDSVPLLQIVKQIEKVSAEIAPDVVFVHHAGDLNGDHQLAHRAALTAFRPLPSSSVRAVLGFEVLSSTEYAAPGCVPAFVPNLYVDIEDFVETKLAALSPYAGEMRAWPHPRSVEGVKTLAALRGSQCGRQAAEAFMLYKVII